MIHQAHEQQLKKRGGCGCLTLGLLATGTGSLLGLVRLLS